MSGVMNAKDQKARKEPYQDLLAVTDKMLTYAENAVSLLHTIGSSNSTVVLAFLDEAEQFKEVITTGLAGGNDFQMFNSSS